VTQAVHMGRHKSDVAISKQGPAACAILPCIDGGNRLEVFKAAPISGLSKVPAGQHHGSGRSGISCGVFEPEVWEKATDSPTAGTQSQLRQPFAAPHAWRDANGLPVRKTSSVAPAPAAVELLCSQAKADRAETARSARSATGAASSPGQSVPGCAPGSDALGPLPTPRVEDAVTARWMQLGGHGDDVPNHLAGSGVSCKEKAPTVVSVMSSWARSLAKSSPGGPDDQGDPANRRVGFRKMSLSRAQRGRGQRCISPPPPPQPSGAAWPFKASSVLRSVGTASLALGPGGAAGVTTELETHSAGACHPRGNIGQGGAPALFALERFLDPAGGWAQRHRAPKNPKACLR